MENNDSGDVYEQAVIKTVAGFFRGSPKHLFGVPRFPCGRLFIVAAAGHRGSRFEDERPVIRARPVVAGGREISRTAVRKRRPGDRGACPIHYVHSLCNYVNWGQPPI